MKNLSGSGSYNVTDKSSAAERVRAAALCILTRDPFSRTSVKRVHCKCFWPTGERRLPRDVRGVRRQKEDVPADSKAPPTQTAVFSISEGRLGVRG